MVQRAVGVSGGRGGPVGAITRGTTNPNRLRRVDRWLAGPQSWRLRDSVDPLVVDLGYGASPATALELATRLVSVCPHVRVTGVEIDPHRVAAGRALERPGVNFVLGGFEVPVPQRPVMIRAFNVLRQYEEKDVAAIWATMAGRLAPGGIVVDGTCDEIGRRGAWVMLDGGGPVSLTISLRFGSFALPSEVAERLPKALIHRNVPGERVHSFLTAMDQCWLESAPLASFGNRQRWIQMCARLKAAGWPIRDGASRWRLGEITVGWDAVAPAAP